MQPAIPGYTHGMKAEFGNARRRLGPSARCGVCCASFPSRGLGFCGPALRRSRPGPGRRVPRSARARADHRRGRLYRGVPHLRSFRQARSRPFLPQAGSERIHRIRLAGLADAGGDANARAPALSLTSKERHLLQNSVMATPIQRNISSRPYLNVNESSIGSIKHHALQIGWATNATPRIKSTITVKSHLNQPVKR